MRRRRILIASFAALLGGVVAARADETFDAFRSICLSTNAVAADALAAADAKGWMPLPQPMLDGLNPKNNLQSLHGRLRSSTTGMAFILTASGNISDVAGLGGRVCALGAMGGLSDLKSQGAAFAAVPVELRGTDALYIWRDDSGAHVPVSRTDADFNSLAESGALKFLMVRQDDKMSMLAYGTTSK